jgi:hypothetical protein
VQTVTAAFGCLHFSFLFFDARLSQDFLMANLSLQKSKNQIFVNKNPALCLSVLSEDIFLLPHAVFYRM